MASDINKSIPGMIRDLREQKGLSQEALANELDVQTNTVSRWETGTYKPKIEDLENIARFFGKPISYFFPSLPAPADNAPINALMRAAQDLPPKDIEEITRYAEFRKARSLYRGKRPGRKSKASE